jgi:chromosome segregation ATPase
METMSQELQQILNDVKELKSSISNNNIHYITDAMDEIKIKVMDLKADITDIKKEILNPETGIIVRINKLQDKINYLEKEKIAKLERTIEDLENLNINFKQISGFKDNTVKFLWLFLGGILTLLIQLFSKG